MTIQLDASARRFFPKQSSFYILDSHDPEQRLTDAEDWVCPFRKDFCAIGAYIIYGFGVGSGVGISVPGPYWYLACQGM